MLLQEKHLVTLIPTHDDQELDALYRMWKRNYFQSPVDQANHHPGGHSNVLFVFLSSFFVFYGVLIF